MKNYHLEIENISFDEYTLMSRGHQDLNAFKVAAREDGYDWRLKEPEHLWFRAVPNSEGISYYPAEPNSRGAFPVTIAEAAYSEHEAWEEC